MTLLLYNWIFILFCLLNVIILTHLIILLYYKNVFYHFLDNILTININYLVICIIHIIILLMTMLFMIRLLMGLIYPIFDLLICHLIILLCINLDLFILLCLFLMDILLYLNIYQNSNHSKSFLSLFNHIKYDLLFYHLNKYW